MLGTDMIRIASICARNAGPSQMAAAFIERERDELDAPTEP